MIIPTIKLFNNSHRLWIFYHPHSFLHWTCSDLWIVVCSISVFSHVLMFVCLVLVYYIVQSIPLAASTSVMYMLLLQQVVFPSGINKVVLCPSLICTVCNKHKDSKDPRGPCWPPVGLPQKCKSLGPLGALGIPCRLLERLQNALSPIWAHQGSVGCH